MTRTVAGVTWTQITYAYSGNWWESTLGIIGHGIRGKSWWWWPDPEGTSRRGPYRNLEKAMEAAAELSGVAAEAGA